MKSLREWIEQEKDSFGDGVVFDYEREGHDGWLKAMDHVLKEIKAREDAGQGGEAERWRNLLREVLVGDTTMEERAGLMRDLGVEREGDADRVNENLNALDGYAGEVLKEKEGGAE